MLGHPHQQVGEAMWQQCSQVTLHTLQSIQSETPVGNDPPLTGGSRTLQSQAGRQGLSPQKLHDSHGECKHRATDSCCREPECCREHIRGCCCWLTGLRLEQIQQNSPGPYLRNWHQNWAQPEHKTHRSFWELAPQCPSSVPITHETKRGVSKPQHRKECTPCLMARAEEQLLLLLPFSWISHCYCWMGGEKKRRPVSISGGGRKWCDRRPRFCSCLLWSDSVQLSGALHQCKKTQWAVSVMPDPCWWQSTTWAGVSPSCPSSPQRQWKLEAEKPSRTTWHPGHHTPPYYFGVMSEVPAPGHKWSTVIAELTARSPQWCNTPQTCSSVVRINTQALSKQPAFILPHTQSRQQDSEPQAGEGNPLKMRSCPLSYISHTPNVCLSLTNYLIAAISEIPEEKEKKKHKPQTCYYWFWVQFECGVRGVKQLSSLLVPISIPLS